MIQFTGTKKQGSAIKTKSKEFICKREIIKKYTFFYFQHRGKSKGWSFLCDKYLYIKVLINGYGRKV